MGSKVTSDKELMEIVLKVTYQNQLFFVDSVTTRSKVQEAAEAVGVSVERRDIFIDNDRNVAAIKKQLRQLKQVALKNGEAIGIGHFYPVTIKAIAEVLTGARKRKTNQQRPS